MFAQQVRRDQNKNLMRVSVFFSNTLLILYSILSVGSVKDNMLGSTVAQMCITQLVLAQLASVVFVVSAGAVSVHTKHGGSFSALFVF